MDEKMRKADWVSIKNDKDIVISACLSDNSDGQIAFSKLVLYSQKGRNLIPIGEAHTITATRGYLERMAKAKLVGPVNAQVIKEMTENHYSKATILEILKIKKRHRGKGFSRELLAGIEEYAQTSIYLYCHAFDDDKTMTEEDHMMLQMKYHKLGFSVLKGAIMTKERSIYEN